MISNRLMKRLSDLKREKENLVLEVEREEELLTNQLQAKLEQVRKEKVSLENELEHEQEYIVNRLQKQLSVVTAEKEALQSKLQEEHSGLVDTLDASLARLKIAGQESAGQGKMMQEIKSLRQQQDDFEKERSSYKQRNSRLREDLDKRKSENNRLQAKIMREHSKNKEISDAKALLEQNRETDLERLYNIAVNAQEGRGPPQASAGAVARASSPLLSFVRDRSRTSSAYTSDCEGEDAGFSASPGHRSRTSSRASSGQKPRPLLVDRTPSPTLLAQERRVRANSNEASPPTRMAGSQPSVKDRPGQSQ